MSNCLICEAHGSKCTMCKNEELYVENNLLRQEKAELVEALEMFEFHDEPSIARIVKKTLAKVRTK